MTNHVHAAKGDPNRTLIDFNCPACRAVRADITWRAVAARRGVPLAKPGTYVRNPDSDRAVCLVCDTYRSNHKGGYSRCPSWALKAVA